MYKIILVLGFIVASGSSFASSILGQNFQQTFFSQYEAGKCGPNIMGLLSRANRKGANLSGAQILEITNKGFSVFGLVNVEFARASGRLNPTYPGSGLRNLPGERNWYHHIVLEKDGLIYDFDFGNTPRVTPVTAYFEKMFLDEKKRAQGGEFYVGRDEKLDKYQIVVRDANATLEAKQRNRRSPEGQKMSLREFLARF